MVNKELVIYIKKSLQAGVALEQIKETLWQQGWTREDVDLAIGQWQRDSQAQQDFIAKPPAPTEITIWETDIKDLDSSQILLFLGAVVMVIAGALFLSLNWENWSIKLRLLAISIPIFISFFVGINFYFKEKYISYGIYFLVICSILFPIFLATLFDAFHLFALPAGSDYFFSIALLTFFLYLSFSFVFPFPFWTALYLLAGAVTYYFLLAYLGVPGLYQSLNMAWFLLVPGLAYLFLTTHYEHKKKKPEAKYAFLISGAILIYSLNHLFFKSVFDFSEPNLYILASFGFLLILVGMYFEKNKYERYSKLPYVLAGFLIILSLSSLAVDGTIVKRVLGDRLVIKDLVSWSRLLIGFVYLALAWGAYHYKKQNYHNAYYVGRVFNFVATVQILSAIANLGAGGHKPIYETMLLLASLAFIFFSIPRASRTYLYVGTAFLIVYIISIGLEYFQDTLGWPVMLFFIGFASIASAILFDQLRRRYFVDKDKSALEEDNSINY